MLPSFSHERPRRIEEAAELLSADAVAYCGGTELLVAMSMGLLRPSTLVDLKRIPEMREIAIDDDRLIVGATATHQDVTTHPLVAERLPVLAAVERKVGNPRVRSQGSLGGNLCFAEPKSDVTTLLIALQATLTLVSSRGTRHVPVAEFFEGPYWTVRDDAELLTSIAIPLDADRDAVYRKFQTMERPTVGVALTRLRSSGACRLVVGAVTEVPATYEFAELGDIDADAVAGELDVVADLTGSADYKRHVAAVFIRRAVSQLEEAQQ